MSKRVAMKEQTSVHNKTGLLSRSKKRTPISSICCCKSQKRASEENMLGYDLAKRNCLLKMARELEDNFEDYIEYEYNPDNFDATLDILVDVEIDKPASWLGGQFHHPDEN